MIEAAGGVLWRTDDDGRIDVLLIHRPRRRDWSLPKGKLRRGENARRGALREVREETGMRCDLGPELPATHYTDARGREKRVRYWVMRVSSGRFRPNREVDAVRWVCFDEAMAMLSYDRDRDVLTALANVLVSA